MADFKASRDDVVELKAGEVGTLESLRQAVVPPFVMIVPFIETPAWVKVRGQRNLEEEGVHGCVYELEGVAPGEGSMRVGFRDLRSGKVVLEKRVQVIVR